MTQDEWQLQIRQNETVASWLSKKIQALEQKIAQLETSGGPSLLALPVSSSSDTAPQNDNTPKQITLQLRTSAPANAAYIAFTNSPGAPGQVFYLVLEEGP